MTKQEIKRALFRDVATVISKDDDLMPTEFEDDSREEKAWIEARDALVAELERRSEPRHRRTTQRRGASPGGGT